MRGPMTAGELMDDAEQPTTKQSGSWRIAGSLLAALVMRLQRAARAKRGEKNPQTGKPRYPGIARDLPGAVLCDAMADEARAMEPNFLGPDWDRQSPLLPKVMELRRRAEAVLDAMGATSDGHRF